MAKNELITVRGTVLEKLAGDLMRVELENGHKIIAHPSEKMKLARIRIVPGDKVDIEMSPYDLSKGQIVYRL